MEQLSETPSAMSHLSPEKKKRLSDLLEQHMTGLESGLQLCVEPNLQDDPEILVAFRDCVSVIEKLHSMASGFPTDEPLEASRRQGSSLNNANSEASECSSRRLGDFQLHDEIGRGGMGVVYRATQLSLKRIVAIKLLTCANKFDWRQISRFQLEAEAAGSLQHPHIVPVIAVGCELGVHFYAMQFIDGRSMDEIIHLSKEQSSTESFFKRPDWQTSVLQAIQAAEGLHAAHELGVIHRDVKPSNLIVDQSGKTWVTDFGLARVQSDVSLTQSGDIVGTMKYMSPEQARGDSAIVDGRADVYSLGVTLYEMLTLKPAHDGRDIPTVLRMIDEDAHTSPRTLRPDLPRDLETVILHAMAKNRDDRYETAKAFADDLRHVLAGEPTIARPPTFGDRIARYANKHRRSFAVSLSAGVIALIGFACFTVLLAAEKRISDTNARRAAVNESRALRNEKIARESIERLGSQMAELLSDIPAAAPVRRRLLSETLDYYQRFASDIGHDPSLRKDLAITHGKIGTCQKELGSSDEAVAGAS